MYCIDFMKLEMISHIVEKKYPVGEKILKSYFSAATR